MTDTVGVSPVTGAKAETVSAIPKSAQDLHGDEQEVQAHGTPTLHLGDVTKSLEMWNRLPCALQAKAQEWAADQRGIDDLTQLQLGVRELARNTGRGSHAYYLKVDVDHMGERIVKLALRKRGCSSVLIGVGASVTA